MSAWSATLDVDSALAVDLSQVDAAAPSLLDARATVTPRLRLSDHNRLAAMVAAFVAETGQASPREEASSVGIPVQPHLAAVVKAAVENGTPFAEVPDVFDPASAERLKHWLTEPQAPSRGVGRYLGEIYGARPELRAAFPTAGDGLSRWADRTGLADLATARVRASGDAAPRGEGVNVVGYLSGELGVGESARLMLKAMDAADIAHATVAVTRNLRSRQTAAYRSAESDDLFDVSLLCVNAKETTTVASSVGSVVKGTYRIGMWYWETEDFPASQHKGFRHLDEVWVATDFVRAAIEPHAPVPVRTITPPLPQPREGLGQDRARARVGLPDRPILLFAFDYASIAERKNPWGLVDAFEAAFAPGERPLLVIKSISGERNPAPAERLRLRVGRSPDILLIEDYLDADDRDALMEACDCYISLHRSEGLGLTMAEAMSMGKPVIATAYGGNMQFMTEQNSFLVPASPIAIPEGSGPYSAGATWGDPDLEVAAQLMRTVFADLPLAAERGRRAADDLRDQHSAGVAGQVIAARLAEIRAARNAPRPAAPKRSARSVARRVLKR